MSGKSEKPKGKKQEQAPKSGKKDAPSSFEPGSASFDALQSAGGYGMDSLNEFLDKADEASRNQVISELQNSHGNLFVQRMLAQRQEHVLGIEPIPIEQRIGDQEQEHDWSAYLNAAKNGTKIAVSVWATACTIRDVMVQGPMAFGGELSGPALSPLITPMVLGSGAPPEVARAFGSAVDSAWEGWVSDANRNFLVRGLMWYPAFAALPMPQAPPTPNIPTPLIALAPTAMINGADVTSTILSGLGEHAESEGAREAAESFGWWLSQSFLLWKVSTTVMNVMGQGPVPSFAPPYVPAGPVVMGRANSYGGTLNSAGFGAG